MSDPEDPGFRQLLTTNLRVFGISVLLMGAAYGIWRGVAALFPEVGWLQG